jgi:hypothetical protein
MTSLLLVRLSWIEQANPQKRVKPNADCSEDSGSVGGAPKACYHMTTLAEAAPRWLVALLSSTSYQLEEDGGMLHVDSAISSLTTRPLQELVWR